MPRSINGCGTQACGARGDVGFNSYDAMEWVTLLTFPLIPLKAYHTFDWDGDEFRAIPIKWSIDLVLRTWASGWMRGFAILGGLFLFVGVYGSTQNWAEPSEPYFIAGWILLALATVLFLVLRYTGERTRRIRRVIGPTQSFGSVDPAVLENEMVRLIAGDPQRRHGTATHAMAADQLLAAGEFAEAMWAARVSSVVEDRLRGEELTDRILDNPYVRKALAAVEAQPTTWPEHMRPRTPVCREGGSLEK